MDIFNHPIFIGGLGGLGVGILFYLIGVFAWWGRRSRYRGLSLIKGYPVRYCTESRFRSWWKFFPWEGIGVLKATEQGLVFEAQPNKGCAFTINAPIDRLEFHGRGGWFKNGSLPWLSLKSEAGLHYLCVETGSLLIGADRKTKDLLDSIKKEAEQVGAGDAEEAV